MTQSTLDDVQDRMKPVKLWGERASRWKLMNLIVEAVLVCQKAERIKVWKRYQYSSHNSDFAKQRARYDDTIYIPR